MKRLLLLSLAIFFFTAGYASTEDANISPVQLALEGKMELVLDPDEGEGVQRKTFDKQEVSVPLAARVFAVAFSPNGRYVASGLDDKTITIWDVSQGKCAHILKGHKGSGSTAGSIASLSFSQDSTKLVSGSYDGEVTLWDILTGKEIMAFPTNAKTVNTVFISPDNRVILAGDDTQQIMVWNMSTGENRSFKTAEGASITRTVTPYAFSHDGRQALSTDERNSLILWDISSGKELKRFSGNHGEITALAFSPDGSRALAGTSGGDLVIFDVASGKDIRTLKGHSGLVRSVVFSNDGAYAFSGSHDNSARLWEVSTSKEVCLLTTENPKQIKAVAMSPDQRLLVTGGMDGTTRVWNRNPSREIVKMVKLIKYLPAFYVKASVAAKEEDFKPLFDAWIVLTPDGYYTGSPNALENITVVKGFSMYKIDQFYDVFYRPDIIIAGLRGEDTRGLITITMEDALKNPPPEVDISSVPKSTDEESLRVKYSVSSGGGGIGEVRVFHNGKLIYSDGYYRSIAKKSGDKVALASLNGAAVYQSMRAVAIKEKTQAGPVTSSPISSQAKGDSYKGEIVVEAIPGVNEISVAAFNKDNTVQSKMETVTFKSTLTPKDPHLYILAVGIDKYKDAGINLAFSAKDARDVANKLLVQSVGIYKRGNIHPLILTDDEATKKNILNRISELAGKMKPTDGLVIFVAGHGVLYQNLYYLIAHDYSGNVDEDAMISSNEIMEMSKKIKSLNQLFIFDTCHAGGVDWIVSGLYDARMSILARQMGLHIFASASSMQEARDGYKGNGLFTYTLLDGLSNNKKLNKNNDGKITIEELGEYTRLETADISRKTGHEQVPMIINFGNDYPVYELR